MGKIKKVVALLLVAVMTLAMGMTSVAAGTGSIVLTGTKKAADGKTSTIDVYRMFSTVKTGNTVVYTLEKGFEGFFLSDPKYGCQDLEGTKLSDAAVAYIETIQRGTDNEAKVTFAKEALAWIVENEATVESLKTSTPSQEGTTTIDNLAYGFYLVYPQGASDVTSGEQEVKTQPMMVTVADETPVEINLKSLYPTVDKSIIETDEGDLDLGIGVDDSWDGNHDMEIDSLAVDGGANADDYQIGDVVTFQLESFVPDMTGFKSYTFKFKDTLSDGLTFKKVKSVKVGGVTLTEGSGNNTYTLNQEGQNITVTLNNFLESYQGHEGEKITVVYLAVLNENAVVGMNPNTNKASVEFSNDPTTDTTDESKEDIVDVHTFDFTIFKYHGEREALAGAEFGLFTDEKCTEENKVTLTKADENTWRVAVNEEKGDPIVTPENGLVQVKGLKAGVYYLKETKAPDGYHALKSAIKIEIIPSYNDATGKLESYKVRYTYEGQVTEVTNNQTDASPQIPVENKDGTILPNTGGMGTVLFTVVGVGLIVLVGISFAVSRKRRNA